MRPSIVFIHLGSKIPKYLLRNLERTQNLFPDYKIVLITNKPNFSLESIFTYTFEENSRTEILFSKIEKNLNMDFRKGYWKFTLQRIFALASYQNSYRDESVLHVESDVILLPNFPFDKLWAIEKLSWMRVSTDHDIAALIYSPSFKDSSWMIDRLEEEILLDFCLTDMKVMAKISNKYPNNVYLLPTLTDYNFRLGTPMTELGPDRIKALRYFNGYFDALGIGVWNFGLDPRHKFGYTKYFHDFEDYFLDPSKVAIDFSKEDFLFDQHGNSIYSLHIHSKNIKFFSKKWDLKLVSVLRDTHRKGSFSLLQLFATAQDYPIKKIMTGIVRLMLRKWIN
jgi:hypothetical protein